MKRKKKRLSMYVDGMRARSKKEKKRKILNVHGKCMGKAGFWKVRLCKKR